MVVLCSNFSSEIRFVEAQETNTVEYIIDWHTFVIDMKDNLLIRTLFPAVRN